MSARPRTPGLLALALTLVLSAEAAAATPPIRLNAGGPERTVNGVTFAACTSASACGGYVSGGNPYTEPGAPAVADPVAPTDGVIHQSEWTGGQFSGVPAGGTAFAFRFPLANGTYRVRLHLAELNKNGPGLRVFDVNAEGGPVELDDVDLWREAGYRRATVRELDVPVADGVLDLAFITQVENAKVGAIEVLAAPSSPPPPPPGDTTPPAPPANLRIGPGDGGTFVNWLDNTEPDLAGYRLSRASSAAGPFSPLHGGTLAPTPSSFTDRTTKPGETVHFRVVAVDRAGNASAPTDGRYVVPGTFASPMFGWRTLAPSPIGRFEASGNAVDGRLFVFGGYVTSDIRSTARSDVFDPAANTWTRIADMPVQLTHNPTVVDGTTIWSVGGFVGNHPGPSTADVWRYDTVANRWTRGPSLPARRGAGAAARVGRTLFFFGGVDRPAGSNEYVDRPEHWALDLDRPDLGWRRRADLPSPRNHLAGSALNGQVYAIGGQFGGSEDTGNRPEVHRYDPAADRWTRLADLPVSRGHTTASAFPVDGRLVVVGGTVAGAQPTELVAEYDPETDVWLKLPGLPAGRKTPVADLVSGSIIATTGNASGGSVPTTTTWAGQLAGTWETGPPLPVALGEVAGGVLGRDLVLVGEGSSSTFAYDLGRGAWRTLAARPLVGHHHAAEVIGGKLYLFGGLGAGAGRTQVYDPATGRWTLGADMPFAAGSASSVVIGGKAYVAGGIVGSTTTNRVARYDPATNAWTALAAMPQGRNHAAAATDGSRMWVFGGRGAGSGDGNTVADGFDTVQVYDPAANTWRSSASGAGLAPLPQARGGTGRAAFVDGEFLVLGGETATGGGGATSSGVYARVDVYDPVANRWRTGPPMPTARHGIFPLEIADRLYVAGGGTKAGHSASTTLEVLNAGR